MFDDGAAAGLTHEEVLAQAILFLGAGYETTANTLAFFGYLLAVNSHCQDKLLDEIDNVMQDKVFDDIIITSRAVITFLIILFSMLIYWHPQNSLNYVISHGAM